MQIHPPLIELLGGRWSFDAPVATAAWSSDGSVVAFGLGDGAVVLARAEWAGGPQARVRAEGGIEVQPPTVPSPPVSRIAVHKGACVAVVVDAGAGFLSVGDDGRIVRIARNGTPDGGAPMAERRVDLLTVGPAGWRACAAGREVVVTGRTRHVLTLSNDATAVAFDPSGRRLATAYQDGVSIWSDGSAPARHLPCRGRPQVLAWSPDGAWLALGLEEGGVRALRLADGACLVFGGHSSQARSLSFSADGELLMASGAARVLYWRLNAGNLAKPGECGLPSSSAPVCAVACHPAQRLVAGGYASGAVLLCQPGSEDVLFIKGPGGGAALTLAWSPDGRRLAIATQNGELGIVLLPDGLFRAAASRPAANGPQAPAQETAA
jgi:WD40 repeat protein